MFWDVVKLKTWNNTTGTYKSPTACLLKGTTYRNKPAGPSAMTVYTDEHGEAQVEFYRGHGLLLRQPAGDQEPQRWL